MPFDDVSYGKLNEIRPGEGLTTGSNVRQDRFSNAREVIDDECRCVNSDENSESGPALSERLSQQYRGLHD